jgi:predicted lipoprotein
MLRKYLKYLAAFIVFVVILTNSIYIKKLSDVNAASTTKKFDAEKYASDFWTSKLIPSLNKAIEINALTGLLKKEPEQTFKKYSYALGIGNLKYFMVKGSGMVASVNENSIAIAVTTFRNTNKVSIETEYVYGNAVRDASGIIQMNEFDNTMDFNEVSAEINKIIRTKVLPAFKANVKKGDSVQFTGAIELNQKHLNLVAMEVTPIAIRIIN